MKVRKEKEGRKGKKNRVKFSELKLCYSINFFF